MKRIFILVSVSLAFLIPASAQECQDHLAYATSVNATISTASGKSAQNGVVAYGFYNPYSCSTTGVAFAVQAADASTTDHYGWAVVGTGGGSTAGTVYASSVVQSGVNFSAHGPQFVSNSVWISGPITIPAGYYVLALGTDCSSSCAVLYGDALLGAFYPYVSPDTAANTPWTFTSGGFSGFTSGNVPATTIPLATTGNSISGTTATITLNSTSIGHVFVNAAISVAGVTTGGATGLNCTSCIVASVNYSTFVVTYTVPTATFSGTINSGATMSIAPYDDAITGITTPTVFLY